MIRKISLTLATVVIPLFAAYAALRYFSSLPTTATRSDFLGKVDDFYSLTAESLSGGVVKFDKYKGQVVLVVNVASNCGYTHQYQGLQELFEKYSPRLAILGLCDFISFIEVAIIKHSFSNLVRATSLVDKSQETE